MSRQFKHQSILIFVFITFIFSLQTHGQSLYQQSNRLGITFISSAQMPYDENRYRNALTLGAGWNRWPLYWSQVELSAGTFDWLAYDQLVIQDLRHGLNINAILLGISQPYRVGHTIRNLYTPIFADGTDQWSAGKAVNPDNPWAVFVNTAVNRYRPGGLLAQSQNFGPDVGIRVWEAWNEQDYTLFWSGGVDDYARLLKITYMAAHAADPNAEVMYGGLAYLQPETDDWLAKTLAIYARDPMAGVNNWYMDIVAVHNYTDAGRARTVIARIRENLAHYGLTRPIWLNESGVPVWDDYPGPTWAANNPSGRRWRGSMQEQAAFILQSTAFAWAAGADVVFYHQLYDDCGNQAQGTDFAPNVVGQAGDAHGLYRNQHNNVCFRQSPQPGTARPSATAFYLMSQNFQGDIGEGTIVNVYGLGTAIVFDRFQRTPQGGRAVSERIYVIWNNHSQPVAFELPTVGNAARMITLQNREYTLYPEDGEYRIVLEGGVGQATGIGLHPVIIIDPIPSGRMPRDPNLIFVEGVARRTLPTPSVVPLENDERFEETGQATGFSFPTPTPIPTTAPVDDRTPPLPFVDALPEVSPSTFTVLWGAQDSSPIQTYIVWVRVNGEGWSQWLETAETSAEYTGAQGAFIEFAVWAQDIAGNWSTNIDLNAQANTRIE